MKPQKAEEEKRGGYPTLRIAQIGRFLWDGGTALESSMNYPYILYDDINFPFLCAHVYTARGQKDSSDAPFYTKNGHF